MKRFLTLNRYVALSTIPATGVVALSLALSPTASVVFAVYPLLLLIGWVGETYRLMDRQMAGLTISLSAIIHMPFMLLLNPLEAIVLSATSMMIARLGSHSKFQNLVYNVVIRVLSIGVPALLLSIWYRSDTRFSDHNALFTTALAHGGRLSTDLPFALEVAAACALAVVLYLSLENTLLAIVIYVQAGANLLQTWKNDFQNTFLPETTKCVLGIMAAWFFVSNPIFVLLVLLPLGIAHAMIQVVFRLESETIEAIMALADSIDARDPYTAQHSERVSAMSRRLAQRLGLSKEEVEQITLAARVHDLGKMVVSNDVLLKEGPLDPAQLAEMQQHPTKGAEILGKYRNFQNSIPIVLHHHERHDGRGYPMGIAGKDIPIGAMIVAHADTYDAMTSDRPYRKGMPIDVALQRLSAASGTQFDPVVTGVFIAMVYEYLKEQGQVVEPQGGSLAAPLSNDDGSRKGKSGTILPLRRRNGV